MPIFLYTTGVLALTVGLVLFSYLDRAYRELGRVHTGRVFVHLETFEAEIEPRFHMERRRAALAFSLLARFWLVLVAALTARGVIFFVPGTWEAALEMVCFLGAEVIVAMQFFPALLLARGPGNWVQPFVPIVRAFVFLIWPVQAVLELLISVLHLSEDGEATTPAADQQQAIEAFVDAATEEGIIEQDEARLIESVVEFGDKRVRDVMTPRPDVIAIRDSATLEELGELVVKTKFSRLPVFGKSLDDITGIVMARDMLAIDDREATHRKVRELMRPAFFVPETKFGSELLKDMQRKSQQMAIVIDEYGLMAGVVTIEDLVEEIVGEIGEEDREATHRKVRELMRPAFFVPETKFGSELLKDMQRKSQQMAIVIDEYGLMAGVVTIEDLVEEIVGEIGEEDRAPSPDVVREPSGALVIRGSVQLDKLSELFGVTLDASMQHSAATTIAGLLNGLAGHVPRPGEIIEADGLRFEVIEANQRKVLRVRARPLAAGAATPATSA